MLYANNNLNYEEDFSIFLHVHLCASDMKCKDYNEKATIKTAGKKFSVNPIFDSIGKQQRNDPHFRTFGGSGFQFGSKCQKSESEVVGFPIQNSTLLKLSHQKIFGSM